jgi:hypothetical protein
MAIARVAVGTRSKVDTSATPGPVSVALPAGHASGHTLLLFVVTDDNNNTSADPAGWTRLFYITNGLSVQTPYTPRVRVKCYIRQDNGALGSSVSLSFDTTSSWPTGKPSVIAFCVAYSGCDPTGPVERWDFNSTTSTATAQAHPQETTASANDWLLSFRAVSSDSPGATFTNSVVGDTEVQDDVDAINELACALYDSNAGLSAGLQTQRTTTASRAATYGGLAVSIVLKPPGTTAVFASAGAAEAIATAYSPSVTAVNGPWNFCATGGLPSYAFEIDWDGSGTFGDPSDLGTTLASDSFSRTVSSGWGSADTNQPWTTNGGSASDYSVGSGVGVHSCTTRGASRFTYLANAGGTDQDCRVSFSTSQVAAADDIIAFLLARLTDQDNCYMARVTLSAAQVMTLVIRKRIAGVETQLASFTLPDVHAAGTFYTVRMRVSGTNIYAKAWTTANAEPAWQASVTDSSIVTGSGAGVRTFLGAATTNVLPVAFSFENLLVSVPEDAEDAARKITSDISISYGRDQSRQLNPAAVGNASYTVINVDRTYSPDFPTSPLSGDLEPARQARAQVTFGGTTYPLMYGKIDDYNVKADMTDRTVDFTFLDGMDDLQNFQLSTGVYKAQRTGELINTVLDLAGWTGPRDIDLGATLVAYWWVEGTDALSAINDLVKSEGPPSIAYQAPDGTFVFRDRHHRLLRSQSIGVQATFAQPTLMDCTAAPLPGLDFTAPFVYAHGAKDIVNSVSFEVSERIEDADLTPVWTQDDQISLSSGESTSVEVSAGDPFVGAVTPVVGTDFTVSGAGIVNVILSRTSGASATITLLAVGGSVTISGLQLRARTISVRRNIKVSRLDADSITRHGQRAYPETAPWANANDADAIAGMILLHYARRRPTVQLRVTSQDPSHFIQALTRTVSDRIHITYGEMGIDDDFFVESVQHTIRRMNQAGKPPVHSVVFGCEKDLVTTSNPFTFDKRGAGFDQGVFDPIQADQPDTVFIFDHPTQGMFDVGQFGT